MKIQIDNDYSQMSSNDLKKMTFALDDQSAGIFFHLFRNNIYSNPIGSVCREIATNARDANIEVGTPEIPIQIEITKTHPLYKGKLAIVFSDDGPGISKVRMKDVFCLYGASTKRDTNDEAGGWGLGGKSPFCVTDDFAVITRVDGTEYTYSCEAKSKTDPGSIVPNGEKPTKLNNGTSIVIPIIKEWEVEKFEYETIHHTEYWDVRPELKGLTSEFNELEYYVKNDKFAVCSHKNARYYERHIALLDGIPYAIDGSVIEEAYHTMDGHNVLYYFNTGELDVTGSREGLHYDDDTVKAIKERIGGVREFFKKKADEYIDGAKSYIDFCIRCNVMVRRSYGSFDDKQVFYNAVHRFCDMKENDYKYNGKEPIGSIPTMKAFIVEMNEKGKRAEKGYSLLDNTFADETMYYMDMKRKSPGRNLTVFNSGKERFLVLMSKATKYEEVNPKHKLSDLKALRKLGFKFINYSTIAITKIEREKKEGEPTKRRIKRRAPSEFLEIVAYRMNAGDSIDRYGAPSYESVKIYHKKKTADMYSQKDNEASIFNEKILVFVVKELADVKKRNELRYDENFSATCAIAFLLDKPIYVISEARHKLLGDAVAVADDLKEEASQDERLQQIVDYNYLLNDCKSFRFLIGDFDNGEALYDKLEMDMFNMGDDFYDHLAKMRDTKPLHRQLYRGAVEQLVKAIDVKPSMETKMVGTTLEEFARKNPLIEFVSDALRSAYGRSSEEKNMIFDELKNYTEYAMVKL